MSIESNSILLIDDILKDEVISLIRNNNKLIDVKFITFTEFKKSFCFNYDKKTIYYLMNKYGYKYEVCKVFLDNMYYIKDVNYESEKLEFLRKLKSELDDNILLIYDEYFKEFVRGKKIYVYSKKHISKFYKSLLEELNVEYVTEYVPNEKEFPIYEAKTKEEEVNFVCNKIIELINEKVDINNIKLLNVKEDYMYLIKKLFSFYNIPIELKNATSLYSTVIGKYFIDNIKEDKESTISLLKEKYPNNLEEINMIINIINDYTWVSDLTAVKSMLEYDLKNTHLKTKKLKNAVRVIENGEMIKESDYVFLMDFNDGDYPVTYKDEDYISDNIKSEVNIDSTLEKNEYSKIDSLNYIKQINNIIISYKTSEAGKPCNISVLSEEMNLKKIEFTDNFDKSNIYNKIRLSEYLDLYSKYGEINENTSTLLSNYGDIEYKSYDNSFKGLDKSKMSDKILLSYTSIDSFYKCSFRYYIDNVLKLSIFESTFMTFIGSLYHHILQHMDDENFDLDIEYGKYIRESNETFTEKELFFLDKLKIELKFVVKTIKEQYKYTSLNNKLYEEKIYINDGVNNTFMGVIDKIMYSNELNKTVVSVVDYKTGNPNIYLNDIVYGIGMQLPIYLYLVSKSNKFKNVVIGGFYLQKILNGTANKEKDKSYNELKRNNLKLQGYTNGDESITELVDKSYVDSQIIKALRVSSKGFYYYSKVLNSEEINTITDIVDSKIKEAFKSIRDCNFDINPKRIGNNLKGCEYCKYFDLCYRKEKDIVNLKEVKFGGEE